MKHTLGIFLLLCGMMLGVACGGAASDNPTTDSATTTGELSEQAAANSQNETGPDSVATEAAQLSADLASAMATVTAESELAGSDALPACGDFLKFCVTATTTGAVSGTATAGANNAADPCAVWAAAGDARILEMPLIVAAGDDAITVALTRIADYTGPGTYELQATVTEGIPDMFPTVEVTGRAFSNGENSTATVTVAADGSGSVQALGLTELATINVTEPDPNARLDFTMEWTCRDN